MRCGSSSRGIIEFWLLSFGLGCECYHWDDPLGLLLVLGELRVERGLSRVESVSFGTGNFLRAYVNRLVPDLDLDVRMCLEVVVPVGIGVGSSLRSEDQVAVASLRYITGLVRGLPVRAPM